MERSTYLSNFSYIFIPFSIEQEKDFPRFNSELLASGKWEPIYDEIRYLHRYVADRLVNENKGIANLRHYRLREEAAKAAGLYLNDRLYRTTPKAFRGKTGETFDFRIAEVQLFAFNTSVCMLAYQLRFEQNDPFYIAAAQYYLRKISIEPIRIAGGEESSASSPASGSFIAFSENLLGALRDTYRLDFFFYALPGNERANFFTYLDLPQKDDFSEELYFLKWCYSDGFSYDGCADGDFPNYTANGTTRWGISPSAATCIVNRTAQSRNFVETVFQRNVQKQYLFTYVFLLHQKYMLYLFLTKISVDIDNDVCRLEDYKRRLYEFNTKYVFSRITEVPQYQVFYERVMTAFSVKEMFLDVQEPLARLAEIQRQADEERQQKYDHSINTALIVLSLLTIVSAVADALGITSNLDWLFSPTASKIIQVIMVLLVLIISGLMIARLISLKNKR